ncbi:MAG TPA: hypothetical protein VKF17_16790 [Isosphaeraceae bacterium]|nr:hypothetical protein [Isosphaeraceae bacterium]
MMTASEAVKMYKKADATNDRALVLGVFDLVRKNAQLVPGGLPREVREEGMRLVHKYGFTMNELAGLTTAQRT